MTAELILASALTLRRPRPAQLADEVGDDLPTGAVAAFGVVDAVAFPADDGAEGRRRASLRTKEVRAENRVQSCEYRSGERRAVIV